MSEQLTLEPPTLPDVWICGPGRNGEPPNELMAVEYEKPRWCFAERKRLPGHWEMWGSRGPSYWEPYWKYVCSGCGKDAWRFGSGW